MLKNYSISLGYAYVYINNLMSSQKEVLSIEEYQAIKTLWNRLNNAKKWNIALWNNFKETTNKYLIKEEAYKI
jgi:hypothetical protein